MGSLLPRPAQVMAHFDTLRKESSQKATDWYYQFSQDSNYIRRDRIAKDMRWKTDTEYGELDISHQLIQAGKGSQGNCSRKNSGGFQLSALHAVRRKHGLCRPSGLSGQTESSDRTGADQRCVLVSSVFPICLLQ